MSPARSELRRFGRHRLTRAALAVLTVVPLLYGALYLAAFWDPYGNLKRIPVALVQEDRPAATSDGDIVHAGQDLADELEDRQVFGWVPTTRADAERGLAAGEYHLVLVIPADFSQHLADAPDPGRTALAGRLEVTSDDSTNYLSGLLARSAFTEIRAAAASSAAVKYFDRMLLGFTDLKTQTAEAADGAARLADGADDANAGAGKLADGAGQAENGAGQLADGTATAASGSAQLASGLDTLAAGSDQLADGTAKAAAGGRQLAALVDKAANAAEPVLREHADDIAAAATAIAAGAEAIADHLDELPTVADRAVVRTAEVEAKLDSLVAANPELAHDAAFIATRQAAAEAAQTARDLRGRLQSADLDRLAGQLRSVAAQARAVAEAAPTLADRVAAARSQVDQLAAGLTALASGASQLQEGTHTAATSAHQLSGGLYRLSSGARQLDGGLADLATGTRTLATGLATLDSGAARLADGLADGAARIPGYDADDRATRSGVLGDLVALQRDTRHAAATYGVGFAPYFLSLALWVGAMLTYMLLRPLTRRHAISGAPAWRVAYAGFVPAAVVGTAQAIVLYLVLRYALGLIPVHPLGTLGLLVATSLTFTAILQMLGAVLGTPGRLVALALLMLQLTSSGGTYPVQTSPGFFQALHPWLPMTYVIGALRRLTVGGSLSSVGVALAVLASFGFACFALTAYAARRSRRLTLRTLHPTLP
ncbi:MAG: YhgE/Pip domain-containing protein [Hamadaea sp.]|uniref:YhgE/Pip domain-containing protein n=1 Tax=Hamadaea sp. TaxID=2024425 RepID=UPI0017916CD1|nr:YhgE/Pip domain-containing protein [Hamadaea sp.]NUR73261.1 YhgE/Pip domain-containing protein [Hamadaea sp.]NUT22909.1 YhgE/Pip domain-containing protein [Hamadaea sp.]